MAIRKARAVTGKGVKGDGEREVHARSRIDHRKSLRPDGLIIPKSKPHVVLWEDEIDGYLDVLMGRVPPPINHGTITLQEVSDAYYARANEISIQILRGVRDGDMNKGGPEDKFRTGDLRDFLTLTKHAGDLGSRRVTVEQMAVEASKTGRSRYEDDGRDYGDR